MAAVATHAQKRVPETPAREVLVELLLYLPRRVHALRRPVRLECRVVCLDELIKAGPLRAVAPIRRRAVTRAGVPASRPWRHARVPATVASSAA